jgi:SAM-dependent methyltransferase
VEITIPTVLMDMAKEDFSDYPCDICGSVDAVEVPHCREYTNGQPIHICRDCGFVYVVRRRSSGRIAQEWSDEIFGEAYKAAIPAIIARLTYVVETIDSVIGIDGRKICDIGAGEGQFLQMVHGRDAEVFGIEPSKRNCDLMASTSIPFHNGTIEDYQGGRTADIVTIMWTLENCQDPKAMLCAARRMLKEEGHLVVATGSRILVPFKKRLFDYLEPSSADTHCSRFSENTLRGILAVCGFEVTEVNQYIDSDVLCMMAKPTDNGEPIPWQGDSYLDVWNFFQRWHAETAMYYSIEVPDLSKDEAIPSS